MAGTVVNIEEHIKKWAEKVHKMTAEGAQGKTTRVEIDYSKLKIRVENQKTEQFIEKTEWTPGAASERPGDISQVVFKSTFRNTSSVPQQHQFEMERETVATIKTSMTKGFSRSGHVGISLDVPELVSNMSASFGPNVDITTSEDKRVVNHSLKWKAKATVTVPSQATTVAKMIIKEEQMNFIFTANVIVKGDVLIRVVDLATGAFKKAIDYDLASIIKSVHEGQRSNDKVYVNLSKIPDDVKCDCPNRIVSWPIEGRLYFRFGISQDMVVEPFPKTE